MRIYLACKSQITFFITKKLIVLARYTDFDNIFLNKGPKVLPKQIGIYEHIIKLVKDKQPSYGPITSLVLVKLMILKTYIKNNLANRFFWPLKSPVDTLIFFFHKPNSSLHLYVNYQKLNNIIIKNLYLLPLIDKFLN